MDLILNQPYKMDPNPELDLKLDPDPESAIKIYPDHQSAMKMNLDSDSATVFLKYQSWELQNG